MSKVIRSAWKWGNTSQMAKMAQISSRGSSLLESTNVPTRIEGFSNVSKIACGPANSAFIDSGKLYIYGSNSSRQFVSSNSVSHEPVEIPQIEFDGQTELFADISLGAAHCVATTDVKSAYSWGFAGSFFSGPGALGIGKKSGCVENPSLLALFEEEKNRPVQIVCGDYHTLVLTVSNEIWATGNGDMGRLGRGHEGHLNEFQKVETFSMLSGNPKIKKIAASERFNLALLEDGRVFVWGANNKGQCGIDEGIIDMYTCERYPRELTSLSKSGVKIEHIAAGYYHSLAMSDHGALYTWGDAVFLQPRLLSLQRSMENSFIKEKIVKMSGGAHFSFALTEEGDLYSWGKEGALARDVKNTGLAVEPHKIPREVFDNEKVVDVVAAADRVLIITEAHEPVQDSNQ